MRKINKVLRITNIPLPKSNSGMFEYDEIIELSEEETEVPYIPAKKDKIYFHPECICPRHKVRTWCKKNDIKLVTDPDKANIHFYAKTTFDKYIRWGEIVVEKVIFSKWLKSNYAEKEYEELLKKVNLSENIYFQFGLSDHPGNSIFYNNNNNSFKQYGFKTTISDEGGYSHHYYSSTLVIDKNKESDFYNFYNNPGNRKESEIVNYINKDCKTLDENDYAQLDNMLGSKNSPDVVLGMSVLANSDYDTSVGYICLLLLKHKDNIFNQPSRNHVNFKSMLNFIGLKGRLNYLSRNGVFSVLVEHKGLLWKILKILADDQKEEINGINSSSYISVKTVTISDELKKIVIESEALQKQKLL